ncbi:ABC transporter permease [Salisediminibacterium selenitireducens]|uniref:Exporter of polyketide antibiotics-like protein n=1 Tax=Bacillus selenitireducens (strain ATCC 700615 / DSM 15326 / MLS10) TaxID=439292 RepID=D6XWI4_BACIE|nr:exporter of polyketide antibiotics-like protein [Salisediminibacterium selenitireducens]ADH97826.1 Putative exporter of polyketide antibiotics-like protein [[Bacillus] selenitireducens MLS10]
MKHTESFAGMRVLLLLALRRDRIKLPVWIASITAFAAWIVHIYGDFSPREMTEVTVMASISPGMRVLVAPVTEAGVGELGSFFLLRMSLILALFVALMSVQLVLRHTRMNEETGCAELTGSLPVGRYALLGAAMILGAGSNLVLGVALSLSFAVQGLDTFGAWLAGMSFAGLGFVMTAVASVAAQLSETQRGASGYATMALAGFAGIASVSNVIGDVHESGFGFTSHWLAWLSPIGWLQQVQAFEENRWLPLVLLYGAGLCLMYMATLIAEGRDIGAGVLPARKGPAYGAPRLLSPFGLAWRLQRKTLIAWFLPVAAFAAIFGASSGEYGEIAEGIAAFEAVIESEAYFLMSFISIMTAILSIYAMQTIMRMRAEEKSGLVEMLLATAVPRTTWVRSYAFLGLAGAFVLILTFTSMLTVSSGAGMDVFSDYLLAGLAQGTALFALSGAVLFFFGWLPRFAVTLSWLAVFASILAGPFFGAILELPEWVLNVSPFSHVAIMPEEVSAFSLAMLLVTGLILLILGVTGFQRRSLTLT